MFNPNIEHIINLIAIDSYYHIDYYSYFMQSHTDNSELGLGLDIKWFFKLTELGWLSRNWDNHSVIVI